MSKTLQDLYVATLQAFTQRPEVQKIYLFGSLEHGKHDDYSDVDLHIVSGDFNTTMQDLSSIIHMIGKPFVWYPFHPQPGNIAYAILFKDYPLYNRLDITILDTVTPPVVAQGTCIYRNPGECACRPSTYQPEQMDDKLRLLYGYAIGALRYAKYRKRGKSFAAYKFYRAQCDHYFLWLYERETQETKSKIDLSVYMALDQLPDGVSHQKYLFPENEQVMDRFYFELLAMMLEKEQSLLSIDHVEALKEIITFVRNELKKW